MNPEVKIEAEGLHSAHQTLSDSYTNPMLLKNPNLALLELGTFGESDLDVEMEDSLKNDHKEQNYALGDS
jgi:hypothetical protein